MATQEQNKADEDMMRLAEQQQVSFIVKKKQNTLKVNVQVAV